MNTHVLYHISHLVLAVSPPRVGLYEKSAEANEKALRLNLSEHVYPMHNMYVFCSALIASYHTLRLFVFFLSVFFQSIVKDNSGVS